MTGPKPQNQGFDPHAICGLAVAGQNPTLVCADENGNPTRRAILWADQRAVAEAKELGSRTGQVVDPSSLVAKGMWVCRHDPEAYRRTRWLLQSFDYLLFRLTGQPVTVASAPGSLRGAPGDGSESPAGFCTTLLDAGNALKE
jgi:sugar (pentulose or hexulose) kinase